MVLMVHNTDLPDPWEREGEDKDYFYRFSPDAYAVGINILLYAHDALNRSGFAGSWATSLRQGLRLAR